MGTSQGCRPPSPSCTCDLATTSLWRRGWSNVDALVFYGPKKNDFLGWALGNKLPFTTWRRGLFLEHGSFVIVPRAMELEFFSMLFMITNQLWAVAGLFLVSAPTDRASIIKWIISILHVPVGKTTTMSYWDVTANTELENPSLMMSPIV